VAALLLVGLAVAANGWFVLHGGFYSDDWSHAADYRFEESPRYLNSFVHLQEFLGGRPLSAALMPIPQAIFGSDPTPHLALAAAIGVLVSFCLFLLLRTMAMAPLHAGAIAALALLFPWSDSSRLWATGSVNSLAVCFFLVGLTIALRGLGHRGRQGIAMHALACLLYLASVLTYEVTAAPALLAGLLYFGRTSRGRALRSWLADAAVIFAALLYSLLTTSASRPVAGISDRIENVPGFIREALLLFASALQPFGSMGRPFQALVLLLVAAVVFAVFLRLRKGDQPVLGEATLGGWPRWMLIGFLAAAAAYFMFLGSNLDPRDGGINNRVNVFAGIAVCLLVYATLACACQLLFRSPRTAGWWTLGLALAIGIGYGAGLSADEAHWRQAADRQGEIVGELEAALLPLPPGSTVLAYGFPAQTAPGVPVFDRPWDLSGALELASGGTVTSAYPISEGVEVSCGPRLTVDGGSGYGRRSHSYERLYAYEAGLGGRRLDSRQRCEKVLGLFTPGSLEP
jgi:hypothetical protein